MRKNKNRKLIFFSDAYTPLKDASSRINESLTLYLSKNFEIEIVCPFVKENKPLNYRKNIILRRIKVPFVKTRNIFKKLIKYTTFSFLSIFYLLFFGFKKDLIILDTSPPNLILFLIIPIKIMDLLREKPPVLLLIAHDLYPDIIFKNSNHNFLYKIISKIFKVSYKRFDKIISCCNSINDRLHKNYDIEKKNLEIIYCSSLISKNLIMENHKINFSCLNNKTLPKLLLMGNIGLLHLPSETILFLRKLLHTFSDLEVHTYISGGKSLLFKKELSNQSNFKFHSLINPSQIPTIFEEPTISLVTLSKSASDCAFPSRISTALSLGSPILLITDIIKNNYLVNFIEKFNIGNVVLINSDQELIIESFNDLALNFRRYSDNSFKTYKKLFQEEKNFKKLSEIINKTCS